MNHNFYLLLLTAVIFNVNHLLLLNLYRINKRRHLVKI